MSHSTPPVDMSDLAGAAGRSRRRKAIRVTAFTLASVLLVVLVCIIYAWFDRDAEEYPDGTIRVRMEMRDTRSNPHLVRLDDGTYKWFITNGDGTRVELTSEQFSERLYTEIQSARWWAQIFNISTPLGILWVTIGLVGQILFTGRMVVQWVVSERARRSVVPAAFWWMSLIGATMLLTYFIWRKDLVGVLGQGTGWLIYIRNLYLLYRWKEHPGVKDDVDSEPALETGR